MFNTTSRVLHITFIAILSPKGINNIFGDSYLVNIQCILAHIFLNAKE